MRPGLACLQKRRVEDLLLGCRVQLEKRCQPSPQGGQHLGVRTADLLQDREHPALLVMVIKDQLRVSTVLSSVLDVELRDGIGGHVHGFQQREQLIAFGGGDRRIVKISVARAIHLPVSTFPPAPWFTTGAAVPGQNQCK